MPGADQRLLQVLHVHHVGAALLGLQRLVHVLHADHQQHSRGEVVVAREPCRSRLRVRRTGVDRPGRVGGRAGRDLLGRLRADRLGHPGLQRLQLLAQLRLFFGGQVEEWQTRLAGGHAHQFAPVLHQRDRERPVVLVHRARPPSIGQLVEPAQVLVVERLVQVALAGPLDPAHVVVGPGYVEAPVRRVGEHHLQVDAQLLPLEVDPLVGRADDGVSPQGQVSLDGKLLVEAGLLHPHHVGQFAQPRQPVDAHGDAELRRVVEHDGQVGVVRKQPHVFHHLVLYLGHHEGWRHDEQVVAQPLGMGGQRQHFPAPTCG